MHAFCVCLLSQLLTTPLQPGDGSLRAALEDANAELARTQAALDESDEKRCGHTWF